MKGICKLCKEEKELIKRSHIFPNFMYKGIGDDKNRINVISSLEPYKNKLVQNGAYEEFILCCECESLLSRHERYANNYLYSQPYITNNDDFEQLTNFDGINLIRCKNINYTQFKLFLQSLIWRASISSHKLFDNFKLSEQQEEQLRNSLIKSIKLNVEDYACLIFTHQDIEDAETDLVFIRPNINTISFFINQFIYLFYLDKAEVDDTVCEMSLNYKNEMGIIKLPNIEWTKMRKSIFDDAALLAMKHLKT
ncbi:MAG: hypothetical protein ACOYO1_18400 [Bacteroidales bacterium]